MKKRYSYFLKPIIVTLFFVLVLFISCHKHKGDEYVPPCVCPPDFGFTDGEPAWRLDGKYIAFTHGDSAWAKTGIYLISPDSNKAHLWHAGIGVGAATWSPDGQFMVGAWGRGVSSTGWNMGNPNYGEGFCQVVPGTLTNNGATLRTYAYDVYNILGQHLGYYPTSPQNVTFQYTVLGVPTVNVNSLNIVGTTLICNSSDYSISNLPAGANVTWSIPVNAGGVLELFQNTPAPNQLRIVNHKWYHVATTLTPTITNLGCGVPDQIKTMSVANDNTLSPYMTYSYYQEACYFYNVYHPSQSGTITSNSSPVFVHQGCTVYVNLNLMNTVGKTVSLAPGSGQPIFWNVGSTIYGQYTLYFQLPYGSGGIPSTFKITGNGACYDLSLLFFTYSNSGNMVNNFLFEVAPNPAKDNITVSVSNENVKSNSQNLIYGIKIIDATGTLKKEYEYKSGIYSTRIPVGNLNTGLYLISVFDGKEWNSKQLVIQK